MFRKYEKEFIYKAFCFSPGMLIKLFRLTSREFNTMYQVHERKPGKVLSLNRQFIDLNVLFGDSFGFLPGGDSIRVFYLGLLEFNTFGAVLIPVGICDAGFV